MTKVPTICVRELKSYFYSPIAYIVMTVFLVISGYFFAVILSHSREATLRYSMQNMPIILLFVTPIITMRLLAEESKTGTMETLMTAPVSDFEVVFGKFLAALGFYVAMLVPTLAYVGFLRWVGRPDYGPIIASYIGLVLMGGLFISIGLFASSLTRNQIVAAMIAFAMLLLFWVLGFAAGRSGTTLSKVIEYIGIFEHFDTFRKGLVDSRDVIYYLSGTAFMLFLTVKVVESRKWR